VVALFGDAGREMNNDLVLVNSFLLLDLLSKVVELTMCCSATAASAGHIECSEGLVFGISLETPIAMMERLLTVIARAALLHNITLNDHNILFF
jgi:hypothetical protein